MMNDFLYDVDADLHHFNQLYPDLNNGNQGEYYNLNQCCLKSPNDFALFHVNICSLIPKMDDLHTVLSTLRCKFDVICITESWVTDATQN